MQLKNVNEMLSDIKNGSSTCHKLDKEMLFTFIKFCNIFKLYQG